MTEPATATVEELRRELARLRREFESAIASFEQQLATIAPASKSSVVEPAPEVSAETIAMIAAAVTSYLGKKVKIRHARQIDSGTTPWAQQGRAIIQASHNLSR